jgi:iron-sulfur cluster repair protein YtfE (RIC family)
MVEAKQARPINQNTATRYDIYNKAHKALRAFMTETLVMVGKMDVDDQVEVEAILAQMRALLDACLAHLNNEDRFIHPAMAARNPDSWGRTADDHLAHLQAIARLRALVSRVELRAGLARELAATELYRNLALFIVENFIHMHVEETDNNAVLWNEYTDEEILDIEQALVAQIPPQEMAILMRWFIPSITARERAAMLGGIRAGAPAEVFDAVTSIAATHLNSTDRWKLETALRN